MFTGIVQSTGIVQGLHKEGQGMRLVILAPDLKIIVGASVSVSGVCLTVSKKEKDLLFFDVMNVTLSKSTLGQLKEGDSVNLETSLRVGDEIGGHFVYGHVDAVCKILSIEKANDAHVVSIGIVPQIQKYIAPQGSVAVDGVSLTVSDMDSQSFSVSLVLHTREVTTLRSLQVGDMVNIEVDMLAKYAYQQRNTKI